MTTMRQIRRLLPVLCCLLVAGAVQAQQQPLTGQMLGGPSPSPAATVPMQAEPLPTVELAAPAASAEVTGAQPATVANDVAPAPPAAPRARLQSGEATRNLFRLQASGQQAGQRLPILGDQATLSYARYLKSFEHEIPDFFETDVSRSKDASSSGR
ncbi:MULTISPECIES: DUF3613 domain-containing protein [Stenotrophomonas maltophilia group]|uniref:DUF3613 domain-containing protein n=1 Tax=Stenotrophomonas maltophilia TaxID=40324 RepID=A0A246HXI8_STEMA|nr:MULTISPECIES: DUF3613 domain-containing protein [Stenotrophomonas maltophilia group]MCZ7842745.1 DUF3613 domain-containing protein [Stenotrophomonas maltophilia]MDJ1625084.1 DUF3613 domain-containing protein [Stenotrophomonas sepilia]OWQ69640.1 hypothetical protein CEE63_20245 [Stenotrophomonas maltophilia]PZT35493.1 hypothetical protein A7X97_14350 [Stenotrophomonas sepilia]